MDLELNLTERLFAAKLGVQPLYFRPPYSIDQEPDTNDQAAPVDRIQGLGYIIVGDKIDTNDWDEHPRKTPQEITDSVFQQIDDMKTQPVDARLDHSAARWRRRPLGHGGALPVLIEALRARGYQIVPVSRADGQDARRGDAGADAASSAGRPGGFGGVLLSRRSSTTL